MVFKNCDDYQILFYKLQNACCCCARSVSNWNLNAGTPRAIKQMPKCCVSNGDHGDKWSAVATCSMQLVATCNRRGLWTTSISKVFNAVAFGVKLQKSQASQTTSQPARQKCQLKCVEKRLESINIVVCVERRVLQATRNVSNSRDHDQVN